MNLQLSAEVGMGDDDPAGLQRGLDLLQIAVGLEIELYRSFVSIWFGE